MTCNAYITAWHDVLNDASLTYQAVCPPHGWEGSPTANDMVARSQLINHKEQNNTEGNA